MGLFGTLGESFKSVLGPNSLGRNLFIAIAVVVILLIVLFFAVSTGYFIFAVLGAIIFVAMIVIYLFYKELTRYKHLDAMEQGWHQLYQSTFTFNLPIEVPFLTAKHEASTIWGTLGWACGRTILPPDRELLTYMHPKDKPEKKEKVDILWCIRVKPKSKDLPKNILCIVSDSQISELSRDASGDWQAGMALLVYGHFMKYGKFYICLNDKVKLDTGIAVVHTAALAAVLERYVNRLSQLSVADVKTKPEIVASKALRKTEAELSDQQ